MEEAASRNPSCLHPQPRGVRGDFSGLSSFSPSALGPQGGWSCTLWKPQDGLPRHADAGPRRRDISDSAWNTPMSKQRLDTPSQVCFLGHRPELFRYPGHTQPSWPLAHGQKQSPPRRWGLQGERPEQRGEAGMRFPSGQRGGNLETPGGPQSTTQHSTTTTQLQIPAPQRSKPEPWNCF